MTGLCHTFEVELYGIPRHRAGTERIEVSVPGPSCTLADLLMAIAEELPQLAAECFEGASLRSGYVASVAGRRFVSDSDTLLEPGETVLILSSDAGG